jgi:hypothetical protein
MRFILVLALAASAVRAGTLNVQIDDPGLRAETSSGLYPRGPLTVFAVE